jgi:hypothetical protein
MERKQNTIYYCFYDDYYYDYYYYYNIAILLHFSTQTSMHMFVYFCLFVYLDLIFPILLRFVFVQLFALPLYVSKYRYQKILKYKR